MGVAAVDRQRSAATPAKQRIASRRQPSSCTESRHRVADTHRLTFPSNTTTQPSKRSSSHHVEGAGPRGGEAGGGVGVVRLGVVGCTWLVLSGLPLGCLVFGDALSKPPCTPCPCCPDRHTHHPAYRSSPLSPISTQEGGAGAEGKGGKQSRSEKKARKAVQKLGMKASRVSSLLLLPLRSSHHGLSSVNHLVMTSRNEFPSCTT